MSARERVSYAVAAIAARHAFEWAARQRPRLTPLQWATLVTVVGKTAGYSRLSDACSASQIAEAAHASERRVRESLEKLERRPGCPIVVERRPGRWLRFQLLTPDDRRPGSGEPDPGQQTSGVERNDDRGNAPNPSRQTSGHPGQQTSGHPEQHDVRQPRRTSEKDL